MKLLVIGLGILAAGLGMVLFTDLNTAPVFIIGVVTTFIAIVRAVAPADRGSGSAGSDLHDARNLTDAMDRDRRL